MVEEVGGGEVAGRGVKLGQLGLEAGAEDRRQVVLEIGALGADRLAPAGPRLGSGGEFQLQKVAEDGARSGAHRAVTGGGQVLDLLDEMRKIELAEATRAQVSGLLQRPGVGVVLVGFGGGPLDARRHGGGSGGCSREV
jgi:hypothetical protein